MCPHQGHGGTGRPAQPKPQLGHVGRIPDLFGQHPALRTEPFDGQNVGFYIVARRQLVVGALSSQEGPRTTLPPAEEGTAIVPVSIAIMVIAPPAWPHGAVYL